jgi:hypothetical protein
MTTMAAVLEALNDLDAALESVEPQGLRERLRNLLHMMRMALSMQRGG